ncbi:hypothetical protein ASPZODRAFT_65564 [Penicilliopsis zonata CBS 506.65]|uniref:Cytochrome P450 n=1 Tax=Penicilliopsis zonata CBS 506.65 TaxID=1073090 RepID=A0A1L9SI82_9EURO|nr:hypothetical protein ASPZODRAFT_65564 [Penicilliopsis zonata CBS 506.65]OJJ46816.1 hypothetical protein ASPZODRAFT_65564 [Penicilliopsis zonata CBS 506.65]
MSMQIPQPPGVPLLGNIFDVNPNNTWDSLNKLAAKWAPIFKIKALGTQIVFIGNVTLLEEVCDERRFRKCVTGPIVEIRYAVHDSLFTAYDNEASWGIAHRIMAPLLTEQANEMVFDSLIDTMSELVRKWTSGADKRVSVTNDLDRLNVESCLACFFDQRRHSLEGPNPPMIPAMEGATTEAMKRPNRPRILNWLLQRRFVSDTKTMRDFAAEIVAYRVGNPTEKKDMLHALLHGTDPQTGASLTESQVIDEIISIFIGSATAPNLISYALYYLLKNPEEFAKGRAEIDRVVAPGERLTYAHLSQLPYCEAIVRETLRLSSTAPGFNLEPIPSESKAPVLLAGGTYEIPHDQVMVVVLSAVNRDPEYFPEPEAFRPERMVGENYERLPSACRKGFGNGKRECIGKRYAWQWSLVTLVTILRCVDIELADSAYQLHINGAFSIKPLDFYALVNPRK